jgi:hypothetical protein
MASEFDNLARVALNEASLGDYMKVVRNTTAKAAKSVAKSAVKGLAQLPGAAIKGAGMAYSAIGGTQGGALMQRAGSAIQKAGLTAVTAPVKLWRDLKTAAEREEYIRQNLEPIKLHIKDNFPTLTTRQRNNLNRVNNFDQLDDFIKTSIKGKSLDVITSDYNKKAVAQARLKQQQATPQTTPTTPTPVTGPATTQFKPKLKANRSMVKDISSGIVYRYLGRDQGGWYIYDPITKKIDPTPIDPRDQKDVTTLWRKKEIANNAAKQSSK